MKIIIEKTENEINNPVNYFLITDVSGSMWSSIKYLKQTLIAAKNLLKSGDTISLAWFSGYNSFDWVVKGASITSNFENLVEKQIYSRGMTCYTQVLSSTKKILEDVSGLTGHSNNVLLFLSDGYPNDRSPENEILKICAGLSGSFTNARIIGYSDNYNRNVLLNMAEKIGGQMAHISSYMELENSYTSFLESRVKLKNVSLDKKYDLAWHVTNKDVNILTQKDDFSVDVLDDGEQSEVFAIDYKELSDFSVSSSTILNDAKFVYSLAFVLSQKNKANLGVQLLKDAGDNDIATQLRKAFTVSQKGQMENVLRGFAVAGGRVLRTIEPEVKPLSVLLDSISAEIGNICLDVDNMKYRSVSRKGKNVSKVKFELTNALPKIVNVVSNENRANISLNTVAKGQIVEIIDEDLQNRVNEFNLTAEKKIELPIKCSTYKNYTIIANGDVNIPFLRLVYSDGKPEQVIKLNEYDVFENTDKPLKIKDFVSLSKSIIQEKAHVSVLNWYIKNNSEQKHFEDWRVSNYGAEGAKLLEEMGVDYAGRYSAKIEYMAAEEDADYIPFLELSGYIKGASTVSASASYKKYGVTKKPNAADEILFPLFKKYDELKTKLSPELFVKTLQLTLEGVQTTVRFLTRELSNIKFRMVTTNSWFEDIDKADEFEYDGFVVKVTEQKEYL